MSRRKRLGERLSAHDPARQVAEVQIRCTILNIFNPLVCPKPLLAPDEETKGRSATSVRVTQRRPPCGRGEHDGARGETPAEGGSSPRARGTRGGTGGEQGSIRFIPASAGNTRRAASAAGHGLRFIPASAGNISRTPQAHTVLTVHPRERGEHPFAVGALYRGAGSSPRARGTRRHLHRLQRAHRFIPASAGNTVAVARAAPSAAVHPRERGEHAIDLGKGKPIPGSSPRARGTRFDRPDDSRSGRFIPASAGNTISTSTPRPRPAVHPRERGEHPGTARSVSRCSGSSPRARGTHAPRPNLRGARRFIPASAGNTARHPPAATTASVHPRERGEHRRGAARSGIGAGSSPRARGTRKWPARTRCEPRFIPASAGNTPNLASLAG